MRALVHSVLAVGFHVWKHINYATWFGYFIGGARKYGRSQPVCALLFPIGWVGQCSRLWSSGRGLAFISFTPNGTFALAAIPVYIWLGRFLY